MDSVILKFEGAPIWILGLQPIKINKIYVPDFDSFSALQVHIEKFAAQTSVFHKIVTLIGRRRFCLQTVGVTNSVWLVSGSTAFMNEQFHSLQKEISLFVTDSHKIWRRLPSTTIKLQRLSHSQCGGPTNFSVLFGATFPCKLRLSTLKRTVGDYIDHSAMGLSSHILPPRVTTEEALYPITSIPCLVKYNTKRVQQGWICRTFTTKEIGCLFGHNMVLSSQI